MNRKRVMLAALIGVLIICLLYAYLATPRLEKASPPATTVKAKPSRIADVTASNGLHESVNFDFLISEPQPFSGAKRDLFRFGQRKPVRTEPPPPVAKPPVVKPAETVVEKPLVPMDVVQKSLGRFTFLGFLEKAGEKTVFLSDGKSLFLVKRGESFGGYQVVDIDDNFLKIDYASWDGPLAIPLIEKEKLSVSVSAPARRQPVPEESYAVPQESTEMINENKPVEGDVPEGEINGNNQ